ncbi:MAG: SCO family protein [Neisseria sp.]
MNKMILTALATLLAATCLTACQPDTNSKQPTAVAEASQTYADKSFQGTNVVKDKIGGEFTLTDGSGQPFALSSLKGKLVLITFGYTHCPDVCPTQLLAFKDAITQLGDQAKDVTAVFVSVDPERDTPTLVSDYAKMFNPDFIGLTATGNQDLEAIKTQYRIVSSKVEGKSASTYLVDHSAGAYILDKNGHVVLFEPHGNTATQIADDLKILLE